MPLPATQRTIAAIEDDIKIEFNTYWNNRTPIAWQNNRHDEKPETGWIRWEMLYSPGLSGSPSIDSYNDTLIRRIGVIGVQAFVSSGSGDQRLGEIVEDLLIYFENRPPPLGVWFRNVGPAPGDNDGTWYSRNVTAEFAYDVIRTT